MSTVESWDRSEHMYAAIHDLADQMTRSGDLPVPEEWLEGVEWFRAGLTQLIGQPTKPDALVILHSGASRISRMSFRWDYEDAYFLCVHEIEPEDLAWEQANL